MRKGARPMVDQVRRKEVKDNPGPGAHGGVFGSKGPGDSIARSARDSLRFVLLSDAQPGAAPRQVTGWRVLSGGMMTMMRRARG